MSDFEHQLKIENQIAQLSGKQDRLIDAIQSLKGIAEKAFAPEYTLDELTIPSGIYKEFTSYGYLYNYIFVGDADAGVTLTVGNKIQQHNITLNGGWNQIHLFDNGWWRASSTINVMLLRSKKDMSTFIGGGASSSSPLYASLTGSSATLPVSTQNLAVQQWVVKTSQTPITIAAASTYYAPSVNCVGYNHVSTAANFSAAASATLQVTTELNNNATSYPNVSTTTASSLVLGAQSITGCDSLYSFIQNNSTTASLQVDSWEVLVQ